MILPNGFNNRMEVSTDSERTSLSLCTLYRRIQEPLLPNRNVNSSLDRVITGNQAHIAAADNEKIFTGSHQIAVYQCLNAPRHKHRAGCCRGMPGFFRALLLQSAAFLGKPGYKFAIFINANGFILEQRQRPCCFPNFYRFMPTESCFKLFGNIYAARAGINCLTGAKNRCV